MNYGVNKAEDVVYVQIRAEQREWTIAEITEGE